MKSTKQSVKLGRAVVVLAALTALLSTTLQPANALIKNGVCEWGEVCSYDNNSFSQSRYDNDDGNDDDLRNNNWVTGIPTTINDDINSIKNLGASGRDMHFYKHLHFGTNILCLQNGWQISTLGANNNTISGHRKLSSC